MREFPWIETERLVVRLAERVDVRAIATYYQQNRDFHAPFEPVRPEEFFAESSWWLQVEHRRQDFQHDRAMRLFLFPKAQPSIIIGSTNFTNVVRGAFQACQLGYSLDERAQGQGYMTEALQGAIAYTFGPLNLHRIMANYMPRNERSARVLQRLGFKVEGYAEAYLRINAHWEDHVLASLTNPHWHPDSPEF